MQCNSTRGAATGLLATVVPAQDLASLNKFDWSCLDSEMAVMRAAEAGEYCEYLFPESSPTTAAASVLIANPFPPSRSRAVRCGRSGARARAHAIGS
jgi:hypothetical protein